MTAGSRGSKPTTSDVHNKTVGKATIAISSLKPAAHSIHGRPVTINNANNVFRSRLAKQDQNPTPQGRFATGTSLGQREA
jgi:hypothetical protein